jgi:hypothetical protein
LDEAAVGGGSLHCVLLVAIEVLAWFVHYVAARGRRLVLMKGLRRFEQTIATALPSNLPRRADPRYQRDCLSLSVSVLQRDLDAVQLASTPGADAASR